VKSDGEIEIHGHINPESKIGKVPRIPVLKSALVIADRVDPGSWNFTITAPLDGGDNALIAMSSAPLDDHGQPTEGPSFMLDSRVQQAGSESRVSIIDDATGQPVSLTDFALSESLQRFGLRFPGAPDALPGLLVDDNKRNFQREYLTAIDGGMTPDEAKNHAITQISFGRQRIAHGYTQFSVELSGETQIPFGDPPVNRTVPAKIEVVARKS